MGGNCQRTDFAKNMVLYVLGLGVFLCVFYQNAWIHEDAFITFRSVEQVFAGHGPVWNPHERVQVYTHPLWFIGLLCFRVFTTDLFLSAILFSMVCWLAILFLWAWFLKSPWKWALTILCLVSTKCIMDFSTSGLEGPLACCLAGLLVMALIQRRSPCTILMVSSFLILCRHDLLLLAFPAIFWALVVEWKQSGFARTFRTGLVGFSPLLAWTLFSVIYYGFPFPNSAYAKLGTGLPLFPTSSDTGLFFRGIRYLVASSSMDPMIPITLSLTIGLMTARSNTYRWPYFITLLGIVFYGLYIIRVGGDYMAGRFCVVPVWTALLIVIHAADSRWKYSVVVVLALLVIIFNPASPLKATPHAPLPSTRAGGIDDERAGYIEATALHHYLVAGDPAYLFGSAVTRKWYLNAMRFKAMRGGVMIGGNMGILGYYAGADKIFIDLFGVTDPLLARLPGTPGSTVGHYYRSLPKGYDDSILSGTNVIEDTTASLLFDDLRWVTQGPLFSKARWKAILKLNGF